MNFELRGEPIRLEHVLRLPKNLERYVGADVMRAHDELSEHYSSVRCRVVRFETAHDLVSKYLRVDLGDEAEPLVAGLDASRRRAAEMAGYTLTWVPIKHY